MNIKRNLKLLRQTFFVLDIAIVVFGICITILGIIILINVGANIKLFPILFLIAFLMYLSFACKNYLNGQKIKYIISLIVSAVVLIITFIGFVATWGM